jgi:lipopolysaccharide biosynthesis regulator YciM
MRAINHLLARERDEAIDELKTVVQENVAEIEPYFALGALFRSRGEWERAIRVHQAIELREGGNKKLRLRARYELGLDFRAAGMPRRATRAMEDCLVIDTKHEGALRALCGLYEEQGRYMEAADAWKRLHKLRGDDRSRREHHLLVAAAQKATEGGDYDSAKRLLREAEKHGGESAHLLVASAEMAAAKGNPAGAVARLKQALGSAPDLAAFLVPGLVEAERLLVAAERAKAAEAGEGAAAPADVDPAEAERKAAAERAAADILEVVNGSTASPYLALALADLRSQFDPAKALEDYRTLGGEHTDLLAARVAAARLAIASEDADEIAKELRALAGHGGALTWAFDGVWRCGNCGHHAVQMFWRCTGCRRWGSVRLDVGRAAQEPPPAPRRERRELPRSGGPATALLGAVESLPEPTLDHGLDAAELAATSQRQSLLGKVGSWFSGALGRGKRDRSAGELKD